MESAIAKAIQLKYQPVVLLWSDEKLAAADKKIFGYFSVVIELRFGNQYKNFLSDESF